MNQDPDTTNPATRTTVPMAVTMIAGLLLGCATADKPASVAATFGTAPGAVERAHFESPQEHDTVAALPVLPAGLALLLEPLGAGVRFPAVFPTNLFLFFRMRRVIAGENIDGAVV